MTDKNNGDDKNWRSKQNWIKDVLSKSGTELMEISATPITKSNATTSTSNVMSSTNNGTSTNGNINLNNGTNNATISPNGRNAIARKNGGAKRNGKECRNKMVYYQSTPLIIKSEQPSQAQFCMPLQTTTSSTTPATHHQQQTVAYTIRDGSVVLQQQPLPPGSLANVQQQQHNYTTTTPLKYLTTNIKTETLPPSISIYATTSSSSGAASASQLAPSSATPSTLPPPLVARSSPAVAAVSNLTAAGGVRKTPANKPQFKCEQCGMIFGSKSAHTSHTKSHAKSNGYAAEFDGPSTSAEARRVRELQEAGLPLGGIPANPQIQANGNGAAGGDPYQCNVCQKTFAVPARLIRHYRTHTGERPFECEFCHKQFSVKENLQVHRRIHTKERPYKCEICGRAFEHSGKLHRHMRIHTGERPHKCSVCEKTFIQSGQLVIHMRTHTGEKPYKCPEPGCGKGFTCSKQLKVHSRTHTGEKPYHCDICFRDFGYNHVLKLHRVQHYGAKCYKCTICDETFKSKKEMEAHIKGHANELPDDDDEQAASRLPLGGATAVSSSETTTSLPGSPQSPAISASSSSAINSAVKPRKPRQSKSARPAATAASLASHSPTSTRSTHSPSSLTSASSRLSTGSPISSAASPAMTLAHETDHHSRDSGVLSNSRQQQASSVTPQVLPATDNNQVLYIAEEMPTDLSIQQAPQQQQQQRHQEPLKCYQQSQRSPVYQDHAQSAYAYAQAPAAHQQSHEPPTINPALLEAASIASRRALLEPHHEEVTQAALQIMQLNRAQAVQYPPTHGTAYNSASPSSSISSTSSLLSQRSSLPNDLSHYDDTREANELIDHYRRGDLARHGIHRGYAPVPRFEPSLHNNEIVRQVEAAIAPLRSSTESPDRSSSPESDSMMMADRDVMTLPLRKRKHYMSNEGGGGASPHVGSHEGSPHPEKHALSSGAAGNAVGADDASGSKVVRMSSVIQFAKSK